MAEIKERISFSRKKVVGLLSLLMLLVVLGVTWAYYNETKTLENPLRTSHSEVAILEEYNPNSSFLPGETVPKKVAFQNTGEMDLYLRVKVPPTEAWYDTDGENKGKPNDKLSTERVIKEWTEYWQVGSDSCEWSKEINGWRYYKKVLTKQGSDNDTTNEILASIKLDPEVSNDRHSENYSDKVYKLTFDAEAVAVEADGGQYGLAMWGVHCTDVNGNLEWSSAQAQ